ncbi:hypothetical protein [Rhodoligotrophos ferricapiens]|uniref:hypothetical protein n=1 Tax=Rhodoligotrophos ferricapiens TaxID=3069264 RepID=UPI00315D1A5C
MKLGYLVGGVAVALLLAGGDPLSAQQPGTTYDDGELRPAPGSDVTAEENAEEKDLSQDENDPDSGYDPSVQAGPGSVIRRDPTEAASTGTEGERTD